MNIDDINALCRDIAEETLQQEVMDYCDALDEEYIAMMENQHWPFIELRKYNIESS